jgi:hypothetical protein
MMDQSVINWALGKRQELRRQSELFFRLRSPERPRLSFTQEAQERLAIFLIDLGTKLQIEKPTSAKAYNKTISQSWLG